MLLSIMKTLCKPILVITAITAGGCASQSVEIGVTTRAETYLPIDDRFDLLTADPPRCAVLPAIMIGTNAGRGVAADIAIDQALARNYQPHRFAFNSEPESDPINVIRHYEVADWCIDNGMLPDLQKLLQRHQTTNYPDPELAAKIADGLGVKYLIFPQITGVSTDNAGRFTFAGLTFIRTGWISMEGTLQIWDAPSRGMAWQSAGECSLSAENMVGISPPVQSAMDALFVTLVGDFAIGRSASIVSGTLDDSDAANPTNLARTSTTSVVDARSPQSKSEKPTSTTPGTDAAETDPASTAGDQAIGKAVESSGGARTPPARNGGTP